MFDRLGRGGWRVGGVKVSFFWAGQGTWCEGGWLGGWLGGMVCLLWDVLGTALGWELGKSGT